MNSKIRKHFEGRFENLSPVVVEAHCPSGWVTLPVPVRPDRSGLENLCRVGYTHVGVAPRHPVNGSPETVADFSIRELLEADDFEAAIKVERKGRPALTSHQRSMFLNLVRRSEAKRGAPVPLAEIGSPSAMAHLVRKGYAARSVEFGPRGGERFSYTPIR